MFGMNIVLPQSGESVDIAQLRELNKALRDAARGKLAKASVGYPQQGVAYVGAEGTDSGIVDPTVPQSIQPVLTNFDFTRNHIWFWDQLNKVQVTNPLHEYSSIRKHGSESLDPFFPQGRVGALSEATYARSVIRVKYMMEYVQLTDVAAMLTTVVNTPLLAVRTQSATLALMKRIELSLFWADSSVNPLAFDGLYAAIKNANNSLDPATNGIGVQTYFDNRGGELSVAELNYHLGMMVAAPRYGNPTHILCTPRQYQAFRNQVLPISRVQLGTTDSTNLTVGPDGMLYAVGLNQNVPIVPVTFLEPPRGLTTASAGDAPPALGTLTQTLDGAATTGLWSTDDVAKDIYVSIVAVGDGGHSSASTPWLGSDSTGTPGTDKLNANSDVLKITVNDSSAPEVGQDNSLIYYRAYVAMVAPGATPSANDYYWVGDVKRGGSPGARTATEIVFDNSRIPGTAPVYIVELTPEVMQFTQLLDFTRRAITIHKTTTIQFALMLFGSYTLMVPHRNLIIDNVTPNWTKSYVGYTP